MLFVARNQQVDVSARIRIATADRQAPGNNFPPLVDIASLIQGSTRVLWNQRVEIDHRSTVLP
jgi:hypothetical protein